MNETEIWQTAGVLIAKHGSESAVFQAARQADRYRAEGDPKGAHDWIMVLDAIEEIVRPAGRREYLN